VNAPRGAGHLLMNTLAGSRVTRTDLSLLDATLRAHSPWVVEIR